VGLFQAAPRDPLALDSSPEGVLSCPGAQARRVDTRRQRDEQRCG
jgi:hypothetical protein